MDWTEIKITVDADNVDRAGDIAQMVVPYGIYIEDYRTLEQEAWEIARIDLIDEDLLAKDRSKGIVHIYISPEENPNEAVSFLTERLTAEGIAHEIDENVGRNADWENNWKKYFKPMPVGERLLIRPTWEDEYDAEGLLLGADSAVGVDIDALAVKTAQENGRTNGFDEPKFTVLKGSLTDKVTGKFDIIVANIVADIIIVLCRDVKKYLNDGGVFITSGIIEPREQDVLAAFAENGIEVVERHESGGWLCFEARVK